MCSSLTITTVLPLLRCLQETTSESESSVEELGWQHYRVPPEQVLPRLPPVGQPLYCPAAQLPRGLQGCEAGPAPPHLTTSVPTAAWLQEMRRVEVQRAAEPAAPAAAVMPPQQQRWEAAAGGAPLARSQSETWQGSTVLEWDQGPATEQLRVEPRAWSIAY